jgi:hypothetical protein
MPESLFPPYDPQTLYRGALYPSGGTELAYRTQLVEQAIRADDANQIKEAIALGWLTKETRCFDNTHVVDYCDGRKATRCADYLRAEGWPERRPA